MRDAREMNQGEKARVRTGRPSVITMIRRTKRSAKKRTRTRRENRATKHVRLHLKMAAEKTARTDHDRNKTEKK